MKSSGGIKLERKIVEKNRRMHMKNLCFKLSSLIPEKEYTSSEKVLNQRDQLDQAASYIKKLEERIERLKQKKEMATHEGGLTNDISDGMMTGARLPVIEVRNVDSNLDIVLISGLNKRFNFHEVIGALEEEGAKVVNASFSVICDRIFHTIHCHALCSRIGLDASRILERLQGFSLNGIGRLYPALQCHLSCTTFLGATFFAMA